MLQLSSRILYRFFLLPFLFFIKDLVVNFFSFSLSRWLDGNVAVSSGKRNVTVWSPSVCLSRQQTHRDSPGGSVRRGQRTWRTDNEEDIHVRACCLCIIRLVCIYTYSACRSDRDTLHLHVIIMRAVLL